MFRGFATESIYTDDVPAASAWYAGVFDTAPYFTRPAEGVPSYVEFRVGDRDAEFGIIDRRFAPFPADPAATSGGSLIYWHVDDLDDVLADLLARGATRYEPRTDRGSGFVTASVIDPFGNVLGVMHNPHYLEILTTTADLASTEARA